MTISTLQYPQKGTHRKIALYLSPDSSNLSHFPFVRRYAIKSANHNALQTASVTVFIFQCHGKGHYRNVVLGPFLMTPSKAYSHFPFLQRNRDWPREILRSSEQKNEQTKYIAA